VSGLAALTAVILGSVVVGWGTPAAPAAAAEGCPTTQVTDGGASAPFAFDPSATSLVFVSNGNHTGENADGGPEIFRVDLTNGTTTQLTDDVDPYLDSLAFSGDGNRAAFISYGDPLGENEDHNTEVFLYDLPTDELTQVTHSFGGDDGPTWSYTRAQRFPMLDGTGDRIFFWSKVPHGAGDAVTPPHAYVMADVVSGSFTDLGDIGWPDPRESPPTDVDAAGGRLVHVLDGEIVLRDLESGTVTELTDDGEHPSEAPSISADGTSVIYRTETSGSSAVLRRRDLVTGANTTIIGTRGGFPAPAAEQSADGSRISFVSDVDYFGDNPDGDWRLYLRDVEAGTMVPLDGGNGFWFQHAIDAAGGRVALLAYSDPGTGNPYGSLEIFLADCGTGPLGAFHRPDLLLRGVGHRSLVGADVYDANGADQTRGADRVPRGPATARFAVRLQNDGSGVDSFVLRADGGAPRFGVRYLDGRIDVTAAMTGDGYQVGPLDRGQFHKIVAEIRVSRRAAVGASAEFGVEAERVGGGGGIDRVVQRVIVSHQR